MGFRSAGALILYLPDGICLLEDEEEGNQHGGGDPQLDARQLEGIHSVVGQGS